MAAPPPAARTRLPPHAEANIPVAKNRKDVKSAPRRPPAIAPHGMGAPADAKKRKSAKTPPQKTKKKRQTATYLARITWMSRMGAVSKGSSVPRRCSSANKRSVSNGGKDGSNSQTSKPLPNRKDGSRERSFWIMGESRMNRKNKPLRANHAASKPQRNGEMTIERSSRLRRAKKGLMLSPRGCELNRKKHLLGSSSQSPHSQPQSLASPTK